VHRNIEISRRQVGQRTWTRNAAIARAVVLLTAALSPWVAQPLSQLFRINLNVRLNEAARDVEREALRSARLEVVKNVKRLYYAILQTESALGAVDHTNADNQYQQALLALWQARADYEHALGQEVTQ
jgi:outer membrane protein TolC